MITTILYFALVCTVGVLGVYNLRAGWLARASYRRVRSEQSRKLVNAEPGPIEASGTLVVVGEPVLTLRGSPAAVTRRQVSYAYRGAKGKQYTISEALDERLVATVEFVDREARLPVQLDHLLLLSKPQSYQYRPEVLQAQQPSLWKKFADETSGRHITEVVITETWVPDGTQCFLSGTVELADALVPASDYRGTRRQLRITGSSERPLLLGTGTEAEIQKCLRRPSQIDFTLGTLCFALTTVLIASWVVVGRIAGL